jgi:hypothetical protein
MFTGVFSLFTAIAAVLLKYPMFAAVFAFLSAFARPDSAVRILYAQPRSRLKLEVRRQKVKSARNRADPYIRLLLVTRPKKYDTFVV